MAMMLENPGVHLPPSAPSAFPWCMPSHKGSSRLTRMMQDLDPPSSTNTSGQVKPHHHHHLPTMSSPKKASLSPPVIPTATTDKDSPTATTSSTTSIKSMVGCCATALGVVALVVAVPIAGLATVVPVGLGLVALAGVACAVGAYVDSFTSRHSRKGSNPQSGHFAAAVAAT